MAVPNTFSPNTKIKSAEVNANFSAITAGTAGTMAFDKVRATKSGSQSINDVTETAISWDTEDFDTNTMHDLVTNNSRITIKTAGKYLLLASINFDNDPDDDGNRSFTFRVNGSVTIGGNTGSQTRADEDVLINGGTIYDFAVTDYIEIFVYQDSGGALNVLSARSHFCATLLP